MDAPIVEFLLSATQPMGVLGNADSLELIDFHAPFTEEQKASARTRKLSYRGVVGLKDGLIEISCLHSDFETRVIMLNAALEYANRLRAKGDSLQWLENLHRLEDPRKE